jgi:flagellar assembly protein FliH
MTSLNSFNESRFSSRLQGANVHVGESFKINAMPDKQAEEVNRLILDAQEQARQILIQAQAQAKELLAASAQKAQEIEADAETRRDSVLSEAFQTGQEEGFQEGFKTGYAQAEQETVRMMEGAQTLLDGAYRSKELVLKSFKKDAGQIIQFICSKILKKAFQTDPSLMGDMIDEAIHSLRLTGRVRVVVCPEVLERIKQFSETTEEALDSLSRLELIADPSLDLSEIFILSQEGNFSLAPGKQVERLLTPILKKLPIEVDLQALEQAEQSPEKKIFVEEDEIHPPLEVLSAEALFEAHPDDPFELATATELNPPEIESALPENQEAALIIDSPTLEEDFLEEVLVSETLPAEPFAFESFDTEQDLAALAELEALEADRQKALDKPVVFRDEEATNANISDWTETLRAFDDAPEHDNASENRED